jgi:hypothetical protein
MALIRFLYAPGIVFAELKKNSWVLPLAAAVLLSMLGGILIVSVTLSVVGEGEMLRRILEANRGMAADLGSGHNFRWLLVLVIVGAGVVTAVEALLIAGVISFVLRLSHEATKYRLILAVCSCGAYVYELVYLVVKTIPEMVHYGIAQTQLDIRTDATVFLNRATTNGHLYHLAGSLDLLTIGLFLLIGFGLSKTIPKMRFSRAALVAMVPWAIWVIPNVAYVKPPAV